MSLLPTQAPSIKRSYWIKQGLSSVLHQRIKGGLEESEPGSADFAVLATLMLHRRSDLASYFNDGKSRYTDQRGVNSGSSVRLGMYSCKMHIWFWALIASLYFIEVTSLPIPQWRSLDENHGIKDRSFLQRIPAPGDFTARFLARGNDQSDNELVDYVQNALGHLKISAPADSGDGLAQSSGYFIH